MKRKPAKNKPKIDAWTETQMLLLILNELEKHPEPQFKSYLEDSFPPNW